MMVVFLAHWCPHCNAEIPVLQEWEAQGGIPEDLQVVGVSTAVGAGPTELPARPSGSPRRGGTWPVLADDAELTAANAYGVTAFPFLTFIDADGNVDGAGLRRAADRDAAGAGRHDGRPDRSCPPSARRPGRRGGR